MRWMKSETGQSIIEFALVLPMLMALCIGMAELGRATWAWNMAQMAASEGARRAIVISNGAWADTARAGVRSILYGKDGSTEKMFVGYTATPTINHSVTPNLLEVDVDIPVTLFIKLFTSNDQYHIHGRASLPVQPAFVENAPTP
jgi:Flp pilus assembly protein TadG